MHWVEIIFDQTNKTYVKVPVEGATELKIQPMIDELFKRYPRPFGTRLFTIGQKGKKTITEVDKFPILKDFKRVTFDNFK